MVKDRGKEGEKEERRKGRHEGRTQQKEEGDQNARYLIH